MNRPIASIAALSLLLLTGTASAEAPEWIGKHRPELVANVLRGKGSWKTAGVKRRPLQRWLLDVVRGEDGEVTGTVAIDDSPLLATGGVRGQIAGDLVSGTITGPDGGEVIRFWGAVKGRHLRGTFVDRTGEPGEWVWDEVLPE